MKLDRNEYLESRSIRPRSVLLAVVAVNIILGLIVWFFPQEGIPLGDGEKIKFVSWSQLSSTPDSSQVVVNIDSILASVSPITEEDTSHTQATSETDTSEKLAVKSFPTLAQAIEMPANNPKALKMLKYGVHRESKSKVVRILHYGDSQLEGDRITDYIRNKMQLVYGGIGPGIVLPKEPAATSRGSAMVTESKTIKKKAIYIKDSKADGGRYGIGGASYDITGAFTRFLEWEDSDTTDAKTAKYTLGNYPSPYINIKNGYLGFSKARTYERVTLLYEGNSPFEVSVRADNYIEQRTITPLPGFNKYTWDISAKKRLKLSFTNGEYPNIFGVALDGKQGVAVDNFAMRGSSAIGFSDMKRSLYSRQLKEMNVCAIVLQYGINVVPNVRSDYGYYKNILVKQLNSIKAAHPGVSIIVIGPSDMSRKRNGAMVSYSNIPLIRDAMRESALETGCCFWDLYEAMGGQNSMVAWVKKGLAQKDYTHFSYKGAKYVGEMFFAALQNEINK